MKLAVLGCHSFGGSWLVKTALDSGHSVIGINRSSLKDKIFCPYSKPLDPLRLNIVEADINKHLDVILDFLEREKPEIIVDFVGQGMVAPSWDYPEQWYETNLLSKVKLVNQLIGRKWLGKYIRISTPEVYGSSSKIISENTNYQPSTPYAISHAAIDSHLISLFKEKNFPIVLGRFANFYGEHQQLYRIVPKSIYCAIDGEPLQLEGGGHSVRSFLHAEDVSNAILKMASFGVEGKIYHFSTGEYISIRELVKRVAFISGANWAHFVREVPDRIGKDAQYKLNTDFAESSLHWQPKVTLKEGLQRTLSWVKKNEHAIKKMDKSYVHKH